MDLQLNDAKVVISGGSQGIGLEVAKTFLAEGATVQIAARTEDKLNASVKELQSLGDASGHVCDVSDYDATVAWMQSAAEAMGGIDVVVHNATASGLPDGGPDSWRSNFEVDVLGMVGMSEGALPFLEQSDRAAMVQIASITGIEHHDVPISPSYGAMKAASIRHMAQRALQWGEKGIRANTVAPGPIFIEGGSWDMIKQHMEDLYNSTVSAIPLGRMGTADEVAAQVALLASPRAGFTSGTNVVIDGSFTQRIQF